MEMINYTLKCTHSLLNHQAGHALLNQNYLKWLHPMSDGYFRSLQACIGWSLHEKSTSKSQAKIPLVTGGSL